MDRTLITQDRLDSLIDLASKAPQTGWFAEVGVYKGGSLKLLAESFPKRWMMGFDTFEGLPKEKWQEGEVHIPGEFNDTSLEAVRAFIDDPMPRPNVLLRKGLFPTDEDGFTINIVPQLSCAFAHLDTDFYKSTKEALEWFWPRMLRGGIIVVDDYEWPNCPGVKVALKEFGIPIQTQAQWQAYIVKE